jgi:hypothetical protein
VPEATGWKPVPLLRLPWIPGSFDFAQDDRQSGTILPCPLPSRAVDLGVASALTKLSLRQGWSVGIVMRFWLTLGPPRLSRSGPVEMVG